MRIFDDLEKGNRGFIKVDRDALYRLLRQCDPETLKVLIWCNLRANYRPSVATLGGQTYPLEVGEFITGRFQACEELNMGDTKYRNRLKALKQLGEIRVKTTSKFTVVTVVHYWGYSPLRGTNNHHTTTTRPTDGHREEGKEDVRRIRIEKDEIEKNREENARRLGYDRVGKGRSSLS